MNIFNIEEKYLALLNAIEENDGVIEDDTAKELIISEEELESKIKAYYYIIQSTKGVINTINDEVERLNKLKTIKNNLIDRLKVVIRDAVILFGETGKSGNKVLDYGNIKFYTRKNEVVSFTDTFYNVDYMNYKLNRNLSVNEFNKILALLKLDINDIKYSVSVDKRKLKEDLKSKEEISGATLIRNDSIIIK